MICTTAHNIASSKCQNRCASRASEAGAAAGHGFGTSQRHSRYMVLPEANASCIEGGPMENRKNSTFVRILIIVFCLFVVGLVTYSFFFGNPPYKLNYELIILLLIIVVLILSESFDNMNMASFISLNRKVTEKKEEVELVKRENAELRNNIINITSSISLNQKQSNNSYYGFTPDMLRLLGVTKSDSVAKEEVCDDESSRKDQSDTGAQPVVQEERTSRMSIHNILEYIEQDTIDRFFESNNIPKVDTIMNAEFTPAFHGLDPIMERRIVFDAYHKTSTKEFFIEVRIIRSASIMMYDRIYVMISKLLYYKQVKNSSVELIILIPEIPDSEKLGVFSNEGAYRRLIEAFQPAIANGLLRIENVQFLDSDVERWIERYNTEKKGNQNI